MSWLIPLPLGSKLAMTMSNGAGTIGFITNIPFRKGKISFLQSVILAHKACRVNSAEIFSSKIGKKRCCHGEKILTLRSFCDILYKKKEGENGDFL